MQCPIQALQYPQPIHLLSTSVISRLRIVRCAYYLHVIVAIGQTSSLLTRIIGVLSNTYKPRPLKSRQLSLFLCMPLCTLTIDVTSSFVPSSSSFLSELPHLKQAFSSLGLRITSWQPHFPARLKCESPATKLSRSPPRCAWTSSYAMGEHKICHARKEPCMCDTSPE